ncbi:oligosaccharide flippase family protein [Pseudonocardia halophobica]|uniref:oligosaccharide flippase family protein n=1 Tax=Pseudonocardia halophobica TaxID=29401 RepID=UPI003D8BCD2D
MRSRIARVAMASAGAQVIGEIISLVQTIVLARVLGPEIVGVFAAGTVLTTFLANFAEGGMRSGLIQRERDLADAAETVFRGTIVTGFLMSLGALAAAPLVAIVFDSSTAGVVAATSSGALLLYSLTNVPEAMLQREFSVKRRLIVGPTVAISFAIVSVTMALLGFGVWSLIVGTYVSYVAWVAAVWLITDWRPGRGRASFRMWRELARFGFPLVMGFVGARFQQMVESIVVGRGLSTTALGYYRYGVRISRIPVNATLEVVSNALFPAFSRIAGDTARLRASFLQALSFLTFFAAAIAGLAIALGVPAVVIVLGEPWRGAGVAVMAMAGLGLGKAFTAVSEETMKGCGRTPLLNYLTVTEVVLGIGLLLLIIPFGLVGVGLAISLTALAVGTQGLVLVRPLAGITGAEVLRIVVPALLAAAIATASTAALEHLVLHSDTRPVVLGLAFLVVDVLAFLAVYVPLMLLLAPHTVRPIVRTIVRVLGRLRSRLA